LESDDHWPASSAAGPADEDDVGEKVGRLSWSKSVRDQIIRRKAQDNVIIALDDVMLVSTPAGQEIVEEAGNADLDSMGSSEAEAEGRRSSSDRLMESERMREVLGDGDSETAEPTDW
jgi:hypothetical protein